MQIEPTTLLDTMRCNRCRFWLGDRLDAHALGECRIHAPRVVAVVPSRDKGSVEILHKAMTCFPSIGAMEHCWEFAEDRPTETPGAWQKVNQP